MGEPNNLYKQQTSVNREKRELMLGQRGCVLWLTGLSGSGKSTIANRVEEILHSRGVLTYLLDGDNVRLGLNKDLGFSAKDRQENIRRIGEVSRLFVDSGLIVLTSFISPYEEDRQSVRRIFNDGEFIEIYIRCDLAVCEQRDPKGLYQKARNGEIKNFTGIDAPYQPPITPEITVDTAKLTVEECANKIIEYLVEHQFISRNKWRD
ncbi:adenylyl-sulfate kinase [Aquisalibacillus elongatus]|uniref:Adenylyl-sulfate kinase n=1 Tax=Aquisalibacillus elongatus TaxID=485577 RepID=A0A3N5C382_9BACI|nr:adenylyl-sulfate kinase [Aquisalibacillus elongatus]RPF50701.1 adenylylsulfate kinase [Aquisalibacillus elongatus]